MSDLALLRWSRSVEMWSAIMFGQLIGAVLWAERAAVITSALIWVFTIALAWRLEWALDKRYRRQLDEGFDNLGSFLDHAQNEDDELTLERRIRQVDNLKRAMVSFLDDPAFKPEMKAGLLADLEDLDDFRAALVAQREGDA